jgi:hypothetical protein
MAASPARALVAELVQFVPILVLAIPFIVSGEVDVAAAGPRFLPLAVLAAVITGGVAAARLPVNPILGGSALWLAGGALGFGLGVAPIAALYGGWQAAPLFGCIALVGLGLGVAAPARVLGVGERHHAWAMVALMVGAFAWSVTMAPNVRLGGGLPFIVLNVVRRLARRRLPSPSGAAR